MSKSWPVLTRHTGFERAPTLHRGEARGHGVGLIKVGVLGGT